MSFRESFEWARLHIKYLILSASVLVSFKILYWLYNMVIN